jgi:hypothetical protein
MIAHTKVSRPVRNRAAHERGLWGNHRSSSGDNRRRAFIQSLTLSITSGDKEQLRREGHRPSGNQVSIKSVVTVAAGITRFVSDAGSQHTRVAADRSLNGISHLGVLLEEILGVLTALTNALAIIGEP